MVYISMTPPLSPYNPIILSHCSDTENICGHVGTQRPFFCRCKSGRSLISPLCGQHAASNKSPAYNSRPTGFSHGSPGSLVLLRLQLTAELSYIQWRMTIGTTLSQQESDTCEDMLHSNSLSPYSV